MKLAFAVLLPLLARAAAEDAFRPQRISYDALMEGESSMESSFVDALTTSGIISITGIPDMNHKDGAMSAFLGCAAMSKATEEHKFPDGTRRRTMATHCLPDFKGTIDHNTSSEVCESFNQAGDSFRSIVSTVTQAFANRLSDFFDLNGNTNEPLLSTATNFPFPSLASIVENGEHLEHFHEYQKLEQSEEEETIEMHTDQGLFIAFIPGRMIDHADPTKTKLTSGFFIEEQDGTVVEVTFDKEDDLVFMLGDGVNQYVNNRLFKKLRAVPHTLLLAPHDKKKSRVWYGRMVLPPVDAVHPAHDVTFGELRDTMIETSLNSPGKEKLGLGCSGSKVARDLSATTCEGDSIYCWHRCMSASEHDTSLEKCTSQGLELLCINPRLQVSDGDSHGDYYPACANSTAAEEATPYPPLPEYPREESACTDALFKEYADSSGYDYSYDLEGNATLMWSVEGNDIKGRLAYDGLFGWIAFGFADPNGQKNGMHGATVIMALQGGNYSAYSGLDLDLEPTIEEYMIHPTLSSFRHWMTPITANKRSDNAGSDSYEVDSTPCFTSLTFKTSTIGAQSFNVTGLDQLVWAANGMDYYAGYHGKARGRFAIDWTTGELSTTNAAAKTESTTSAAAFARTMGVSFLSLALALKALF